jgi:hypothetical protein
MNAYAFHYDRRPDGSTGFDLVPWAPTPAEVAAMHLPLVLFSRARRGRRAARAEQPLRFTKRAARPARFANDGKSLRIECGGPDYHIQI